MGGEARCQDPAGRLGHLGQPLEGRPGPFGVHVVGGDGRDTTPVVDTRIEEHAEVVGQVGRGLQVHVGRQHDPGHGQRAEVVLGWAGRRLVHGRARLGQEVLDDDLLDVTVSAMRRHDRLEALDARLGRLADTDEDAGGERNRERPGRVQGGQTSLGLLVRCAPVAVQVGLQRLDHHALRRRHRPQGGELVGEEGSGVGMGQQSGLVQNELGHGHQVVDRAGVAVLVQPLRGDRPTELGSFAQREERLVASGLGAGTGDVQHPIGREVGRVQSGRWPGERAVAAAVLAELGERDEHLGGVSDAGAPRPITDVPSTAHQRVRGLAQQLRVHRGHSTDRPDQPLGSRQDPSTLAESVSSSEVKDFSNEATPSTSSVSVTSRRSTPTSARPSSTARAASGSASSVRSTTP